MSRILLLASLMMLQSCSMWPYEKDFDCPISEGLKCKSLYEVSELADQGYFGPDKVRTGKCKCDTAGCDRLKSQEGGKR